MERPFIILLKLAALLYIACSCKKEYDYPPLKDVNDGARIGVRQLKGRVPAPLTFYRFKEGDTNLYCTVISDELSGNFYGQVFVKDEEGGAIQLNLKESGGLYTGDKIRINLNRLYLVSSNNMIYLDSVDVAKSVVKLSSGNEVEPKLVSLDDILSYSATPGHSLNLQSQLVQLNGMEFRPNTLVHTFADAIGKTTVSQTISTCEAGKWLTVRTSGRANFAGKPLPGGNGSITGIVSQYNNSMQLSLRDYKEVQMTGPLCAAPTTTQAAGTFLLKDFNDYQLSSSGWTNYAAVNTSVNWTIGTSSLSPSPFAKISGYLGSNTNSESWLISPAINLSTAKDPVLGFKSAAKFSGTVLEVLISTHYTSGNPAPESWTSLSPGYVLSPASGDYLWTFSGYVALSAYKAAGVRIAFKYKSSTTGATSYQLDDIVVKER